MVARDLAEAIPAEARRRLERELRQRAFDHLHAEAVAAGDLPAAPRAWSEGAAGGALRLLLGLALGGAIGALAVAAVVFVLGSMRIFQ